MLTLPVPLFAALILGFVMIRHILSGDRPALFLAVLGASMAQSLIISLTQHYGASWLMPVQPVTASIVPVLAWLAFQAAAFRAPEAGRDAVHLAPPLFIAFCVAFVPLAIDFALPLIFAGYGAAMLFAMRNLENMPHARLAAGPLPVRIWKVMAALLILSALSDVMIAAALSLGFDALRSVIVSVFTSGFLLGVGALSVSPHADIVAEREEEEAPPEPSEAETALIARLDAFMKSERPYLDPDLTLARLARRLHVPVKQLSAAINRIRGENVSRYVNGFRVREACRKIEGGASVTEAMLASGFNTKSNFNREFLRVTGRTPSAFASDPQQAHPASQRTAAA